MSLITKHFLPLDPIKEATGWSFEPHSMASYLFDGTFLPDLYDSLNKVLLLTKSVCTLSLIP